jgi:hypothetical protein
MTTSYANGAFGVHRVDAHIPWTDTPDDDMSIMGYTHLDTVKPTRLALVKPRGKAEYHFKVDNYAVNGTKTVQPVPAYVAPISRQPQKRPDLVLHDGPNPRRDAAVACAYMPFSTPPGGGVSSRNVRVGLGDADSSSLDTLEWEDLEQLTSRQFRWTMDVSRAGQGGCDDGGWRRPVEFVWKRTSHVAADGLAVGMLSTCSYKLVEAHSGSSSGDVSADADKVLAVFTQQSGSGRCGVLQINVDYGTDFYHMVLITSMALYEKRHRRRRS